MTLVARCIIGDRHQASNRFAAFRNDELVSDPYIAQHLDQLRLCFVHTGLPCRPHFFIIR